MAIYKSFEGELDTKNGYIVSGGDGILELESVHLDTNERDTVTFFRSTAKYHAGASWSMALIQELLDDIAGGNIEVRGQYDATDALLPQHRYRITTDKVTIGAKISRAARDHFKYRCMQEGVSQSEVLETFIWEF